MVSIHLHKSIHTQFYIKISVKKISLLLPIVMKQRKCQLSTHTVGNSARNISFIYMIHSVVDMRLVFRTWCISFCSPWSSIEHTWKLVIHADCEVLDLASWQYRGYQHMRMMVSQHMHMIVSTMYCVTHPTLDFRPGETNSSELATDTKELFSLLKISSQLLGDEDFLKEYCDEITTSTR